MRAELLSLCLLGCFAAGAAEQPAAPASPIPAVQVLAQRPLPPQQAEAALVFIGGFGDEISGIVHALFRRVPASALGVQAALRAYYYWNGGNVEDAPAGYRSIAEDVAAFRRTNPQADVVLIGHSMGGAAALQVAALLPAHAGAGRVFVLTLDPVDRMVQPVRTQGVSWWGNAYVVNSLSGHDFIAVVGGRWGHCEQADHNIRFDGRRTDEYGYHYIHDDAEALLTSAGGQPAGALSAALAKQLQRKAAESQADVAQQPQRPKTNGHQGQ